MERKKVATLSAAAIAAITASCLYLDHDIALLVSKLALGNPALTGEIPDHLLPAVLVTTFLLWGAYLHRVHRGIDDARTGFFQLGAWTVPMAFVLKSVLKPLFGRMNTQFWLLHQSEHDFLWFQPGRDYSGFPSGHMAVFSAFIVSAWLCYPRFRLVYLGLMLMLGVALIVTGYHFLGDVLAGAFLGLLVNFWVTRYINSPREKNHGTP
jgi:membrane-associated phospholipid phosphatase